MNRQKVIANFSWQSPSITNHGPHRFWVRQLPHWYFPCFNVHHSTIPLILWRSASWGTAVHQLGCAEPPSLPGICTVLLFQGPLERHSWIKAQIPLCSPQGPRAAATKVHLLPKAEGGVLQEFFGKKGSANHPSLQMELGINGG